MLTQASFFFFIKSLFDNLKIISICSKSRGFCLGKRKILVHIHLIPWSEQHNILETGRKTLNLCPLEKVSTSQHCDPDFAGLFFFFLRWTSPPRQINHTNQQLTDFILYIQVLLCDVFRRISTYSNAMYVRRVAAENIADIPQPM